LQQVPGVGAATMLRLARVFGSAEGAARAEGRELSARGRLTAAQVERLEHVRAHEGALRSTIEEWREAGIELVCMGSEGYPAALLSLRRPPPLLYIRGALEEADRRAVAVVGTRRPDAEGAALAGRLACEFARRGYTIVSGLARGIDTAGHRGALTVGEGRTIAVLGCGLLRVYPRENQALAEAIVQRGCLLSEVPPETEVQAAHLLARDRIQAALSRAVIVVQAQAQCGSIVTARQAVRCGRRLYGVPWKRPPFSEGWEALARMGARPVKDETDLDALSVEIESEPEPPEQGALLS